MCLIICIMCGGMGAPKEFRGAKFVPQDFGGYHLG